MKAALKRFKAAVDRWREGDVATRELADAQAGHAIRVLLQSCWTIMDDGLLRNSQSAHDEFSATVAAVVDRIEARLIIAERQRVSQLSANLIGLQRQLDMPVASITKEAVPS